MASFGAKYPHFSKIKTEPDDALPTYEGPVNIGRLVKADLTVNLGLRASSTPTTSSPRAWTSSRPDRWLWRPTT